MSTATLLGTPPEEALAAAFARLVRELHLYAGGRVEDAEAVAFAASLCSRAASEGRSSIDVAGIEAQEFLRTINYFPLAGPPLETWLRQLARSPVVAHSGDPNDFRPLVLAGATRLYLYRYFDYERRLAARLAEMNRPAALPCPAPMAAALLSQLFPQEGGVRPDRQKIAAATALLRRLCIVSGGPGTGKTTTVVRVLALLLDLHPALRVALAAPTGKAAARLRGSLRTQLAGLPVSAELKARLPAETYTVHRLLGHRPGRVSFRHDREHPLPYDLVVVDEASMLDLALATKLVEALPDEGRLILLGDQDQLSAVETGTVFANLCATRGMSAGMRQSVQALTHETLPETETGAAQGLADAVVWLEQGHRYAQGGAIGTLVERVREGDAEAVLAWLAGRSGGEIGSEVVWQDTVPGAEPLAATLIEGYAEYLDAVQSGAPPAVVLAAFERRRVLCAVREGEQGTARLNALLTEHFRARLGGRPSGASWYAGRPVLITANDYTVRVFNGDVGVTLPGPEGRFLVHFEDRDEGTRPLAPSRLPEHETAFAMTVHKAQGSEFEHAEVVLPARDSRVLTRELLYTALTRAGASVRLWARAAVLRDTITRRSPKAPLGLWEESGR
ncbi:MAG: exodeoxyribonuclease V subunit alpha [Gammaproteobacteria bacterium]